jgi:N6-L-threonylcarbamoyladenine synthase
MLCLSVESSCDETSIALLELDREGASDREFCFKLNSVKVLGSIISSQIKIHAKYGGVVPEIGAREHAEQIHFLFNKMLKEVDPEFGNGNFELLRNLEYIFVTSTPGLASALKVGIEFSRSIRFYLQNLFGTYIKLELINHLKGHVATCFLDQKNLDLEDSEVFPHLHLLVSGGNTQLRILNSYNDWAIVGGTLDDAVGECFDKCARMVGIDYPGGATLSRIAGNNFSNILQLPIPMSGDKSFNFSLSGLKTAVRYKIQKSTIEGIELEKKLSEDEVAILMSISKQEDLISTLENLEPRLKFIYEICVSSQFAILTHVFQKTKLAYKHFKPKSIGLSGGVSANRVLRQKLLDITPKLFIPPIELTGDNAVMIGIEGILGTLYS